MKNLIDQYNEIMAQHGFTELCNYMDRLEDKINFRSSYNIKTDKNNIKKDEDYIDKMLYEIIPDIHSNDELSTIHRTYLIDGIIEDIKNIIPEQTKYTMPEIIRYSECLKRGRVI